MELSKLSKVELELLSYTDITEMILKENKSPMNTPSIFKKICELLDYTDDQYASKIGDYYTSLTIDNRFVLLDSAEWDLKKNYAIPLDNDEEEESEEDEDIEEIEEEEEEEVEEEESDEEDIDAIDDSEDLIDDDDDIDDLAIIDENDEELEES